MISHSSVLASISEVSPSVNSDIVICSSGAKDAANSALVSPSLLASDLNQLLTFRYSTSGQPKYSANLLVASVYVSSLRAFYRLVQDRPDPLHGRRLFGPACPSIEIAAWVGDRRLMLLQEAASGGCRL